MLSMDRQFSYRSYANSMMVFLNDRVSSNQGHDSHVVTVPLSSLHFATVDRPGDIAQEPPSLEGHGDVRSSMLERIVIEEASIVR